MKIIAYTYEAAMHCPACARVQFGAFQGESDEHGVWLDAKDREGNHVAPVFDTDETSETHCDTCRGPF